MNVSNWSFQSFIPVEFPWLSKMFYFCLFTSFLDRNVPYNTKPLHIWWKCVIYIIRGFNPSNKALYNVFTWLKTKQKNKQTKKPKCAFHVNNHVCVTQVACCATSVLLVPARNFSYAFLRYVVIKIGKRLINEVLSELISTGLKGLKSTSLAEMCDMFWPIREWCCVTFPAPFPSFAVHLSVQCHVSHDCKLHADSWWLTFKKESNIKDVRFHFFCSFWKG